MVSVTPDIAVTPSFYNGRPPAKSDSVVAHDDFSALIDSNAAASSAPPPPPTDAPSRRSSADRQDDDSSQDTPPPASSAPPPQRAARKAADRSNDQAGSTSDSPRQATDASADGGAKSKGEVKTGGPGKKHATSDSTDSGNQVTAASGSPVVVVTTGVATSADASAQAQPQPDATAISADGKTAFNAALANPALAKGDGKTAIDPATGLPIAKDGEAVAGQTAATTDAAAQLAAEGGSPAPQASGTVAAGIAIPQAATIAADAQAVQPKADLTVTGGSSVKAKATLNASAKNASTDKTAAKDAAAAKPASQDASTTQDTSSDQTKPAAQADGATTQQPAIGAHDHQAAAPQPSPADAAAALQAPVAAPPSAASSLNLTATAVPQASVPAATAPVPLNGLAVDIALKAAAGNSRFEIRLDPAELGRIDVRLDVDKHGQVTSHLTVENPATLDLLRRDAPQLQRALEDAGLKTGDSGLQFSLRDQSSSGQQNDSGQGRNSQRLIVSEETPTPPVAAVSTSYGRSLGSRTGVDISI